MSRERWECEWHGKDEGWWVWETGENQLGGAGQPKRRTMSSGRCGVHRSSAIYPVETQEKQPFRFSSPICKLELTVQLGVQLLSTISLPSRVPFPGGWPPLSRASGGGNPRACPPWRRLLHTRVSLAPKVQGPSHLPRTGLWAPDARREELSGVHFTSLLAQSNCPGLTAHASWSHLVPSSFTNL